MWAVSFTFAVALVFIIVLWSGICELQVCFSFVPLVCALVGLERHAGGGWGGPACLGFDSVQRTSPLSALVLRSGLWLRCLAHLPHPLLLVPGPRLPPAVKAAGATAKHCIVLHGQSNFLSGTSRSTDFDHECCTRANVAYSRATDLTVCVPGQYAWNCRSVTGPFCPAPWRVHSVFFHERGRRVGGVSRSFFFHEYGRRVGMVPRSSLKEGKKRQMVEKGTKTPKNNPKTKHPSPQADSTIL